jgi:hypothetical protein
MLRPETLGAHTQKKMKARWKEDDPEYKKEKALRETEREQRKERNAQKQEVMARKEVVNSRMRKPRRKHGGDSD